MSDDDAFRSDLNDLEYLDRLLKKYSLSMHQYLSLQQLIEKKKFTFVRKIGTRWTVKLSNHTYLDRPDGFWIATLTRKGNGIYRHPNQFADIYTVYLRGDSFGIWRDITDTIPQKVKEYVDRTYDVIRDLHLVDMTKR